MTLLDTGNPFLDELGAKYIDRMPITLKILPYMNSHDKYDFLCQLLAQSEEIEGKTPAETEANLNKWRTFFATVDAEAADKQ